MVLVVLALASPPVLDTRLPHGLLPGIGLIAGGIDRLRIGSVGRLDCGRIDARSMVLFELGELNRSIAEGGAFS